MRNDTTISVPKVLKVRIQAIAHAEEREIKVVLKRMVELYEGTMPVQDGTRLTLAREEA